MSTDAEPQVERLAPPHWLFRLDELLRMFGEDTKGGRASSAEARRETGAVMSFVSCPASEPGLESADTAPILCSAYIPRQINYK